MRSVLYIEEDFVAGLLKDYFSGNHKSTQFLRRGANGNLCAELARDSTDFFIAQSEDPERLARVLQTVQRNGNRIPTLVLTSQSDRIPEDLKSFAHCVSLQELLESNKIGRASC